MKKLARTSGKSALWLILGCGVTVFSLVFISSQIEFSGTGAIRLATATAVSHGAPNTKTPANENTTQGPIVLEKLACFTCHNIGKYQKGKKMPHALHKEEGVGHCHTCHAFSGHFKVSVRKEACEECH